RRRLCSALIAQQEKWGADPGAVRSLADGAQVVITGQQAGLFTGPVYSILKALTTIKLARSLKERGIEAVPLFWIAAEDHDSEEIRSTAVLNRNSGLDRIEVDLPNPAGSPVGWLGFGEDVRDAIQRCISALPDSEFQPNVRSLLEETHRPGDAPVDAFGR